MILQIYIYITSSFEWHLFLQVSIMEQLNRAKVINVVMTKTLTLKKI